MRSIIQRAGLLTALLLLALSARPAAAQPPAVIPPEAAPCEVAADPCLKKACLPETVQRKVSHTIYEARCDDYCVKKIGHFRLFLSPAYPEPPDECPRCSCHPRQKKVLLKKVVTEQYPTTECKPALVPGSCPNCGQ